MYTDDLISREELNERICGMRIEIEQLYNELKIVSYHLTKGAGKIKKNILTLQRRCVNIPLL